MKITNELEACKAAIIMQDACNLRGLARAFVDSVGPTHPATKLALNKLCSLAETDASYADFQESFTACEKLLQKGEA